jgi:hypothetical protein
VRWHLKSGRLFNPKPMGKRISEIECRAVLRRGRSGWLLANDQIALCCLRGGGHIQSFSRRHGAGKDLNLLWEPPWQTIEPWRYSEQKHGRKYGKPPLGKYLSGYTGHSLCLDYFGAPSAEEALLGLPLHGEVASSRWVQVKKSARSGVARLGLRAMAPSSGLAAYRELVLRSGESIVYVTETVTNKTNRDRYFQWAEHATFGAPFLRSSESVCLIPGSRSKTWPLGYEGKAALASDTEFVWPNAPAGDGSLLNVSKPFTTHGRGFIATTLLSDTPNLQLSYIAVLNWRLGLLAGYCFRRSDFPWVVNWEENCARNDSPWNARTQARGLEFSTSPLPLGLRDAILNGPLFGVPAVRCLPARGRQSISYVMFVTEAPQAWRTISGVSMHGKVIEVTGPASSDRIELIAEGLSELWPDRHGELPPELS